MLLLPKIFADLVDRMVAPTKDADSNNIPVECNDAPLPLPTGMRTLLLAILAAGYDQGAAQTRLSNAPDAAIAWQVQSMLDDYADPEALDAYRAAA